LNKEGQLMNQRTTDWRANFRRHTMNLGRTPHDGGQSHWILQDKSLRDMVHMIEKDCDKLRAIGGDPLPGQDICAEAVIAKLGYRETIEPKGVLANAKFTAGFVAACTRETFRIGSEIDRLRHRSRPRAWHR
jgi:hypothetical protein